MLDLNQMALYHYCHPGCEPFRNIMRLPKEEAFRFARELAEKNPQSTTFYRFADFENYYPHRIKTDTELYRRFIACGGRPAQAHPLSFVLGGQRFSAQLVRRRTGLLPSALRCTVGGGQLHRGGQLCGDGAWKELRILYKDTACRAAVRVFRNR